MAEEFAEKALTLTKRGAFEDAGDHYTQAAYQSLAHDAITTESEHQIGAGLERLLRAALCYRRAALPTRCRNRCEQGILIATDLQHDTVTAAPKVAVLQEYIADFHGLGGIDGADRAYRETLEQLTDAGIEYSTSLHSSPLADSIIEFTRYLSQWAEPDESLELVYDFAGRVSYKRREMNRILEAIDS